MDIKTYSKFDGMDEPKEDELMRMITVYRITDIDSHFQEGQFIQDLHGFIATPFAAGYNPTFYKKIGIVIDNSNLATSTIIKDSNGEVHIIKNEDVKEDDSKSKLKTLILNKKNSSSTYNSSMDAKYKIVQDDGTTFTVDDINDINDKI
jgi:hypothetical protein